MLPLSFQHARQVSIKIRCYKKKKKISYIVISLYGISTILLQILPYK